MTCQYCTSISYIVLVVFVLIYITYIFFYVSLCSIYLYYYFLHLYILIYIVISRYSSWRVTTLSYFYFCVLRALVSYHKIHTVHFVPFSILLQISNNNIDPFIYFLYIYRIHTSKLLYYTSRIINTSCSAHWLIWLPHSLEVS